MKLRRSSFDYFGAHRSRSQYVIAYARMKMYVEMTELHSISLSIILCKDGVEISELGFVGTYHSVSLYVLLCYDEAAH